MGWRYNHHPKHTLRQTHTARKKHILSGAIKLVDFVTGMFVLPECFRQSGRSIQNPIKIFKPRQQYFERTKSIRRSPKIISLGVHWGTIFVNGWEPQRLMVLARVSWSNLGLPGICRPGFLCLRGFLLTTVSHIPSMGLVYASVNHGNQPNVGKYTMHGWYGYGFRVFSQQKQRSRWPRLLTPPFFQRITDP